MPIRRMLEGGVFDQKVTALLSEVFDEIVSDLDLRNEPRQGAILVFAREPAIADHIGDQDRRNFRVSVILPPAPPCAGLHKGARSSCAN